MPTDNSNAFSPQDLTRTEDQNKVFPNARGQVVPAIESAPEEPQDWQTPMAKPESGWQQEGTPLTIQARPKEVNKILNSKHILSDVDTSDPSNARVFVANFLNSKYSEDKRGIYKDYEGKTKAYGLSGDPVADAKSILDGDTKIHESSQTRIAKDRKVIAEGLDRLEPEEGQGFIEKRAKVVGSTGSKVGWSIFRSGQLLGGELFNDRFRDELRAEYDRSAGNKVSASNPIVSREELMDFSSQMVASTEKAFDVDPEYANTMEGAILSGLTQITLQIATAGLGLPAQMYDEGIQDAEASMGKLYSEMTMLEQAKARQLAGPYALVATGLEALPLGKMFKNLTGTTKEVVSKMNSKSFLKEFGAGFLGEGITESAQKQLLGELGKRVLEDGRDVWNVESLKDLAKEFLVAGTVGGIARGGPVAVSKALNKFMDPVEGMSAIDMALAQNVVPEAEFNAYTEELYGDQTTEEGVPLQELAQKARQGDRKAAEQLVEAVTVEASRGAVEAGLTPAEAEARGKEAAEVADPVEPLAETPIDKEISTKKEELVALEEAEESTPEDMKKYEELDKEIQALEAKRIDEIVKGKMMTPFTRGVEAEKQRVEQARLDKADRDLEQQDQVIDLINRFLPLSKGTTVKNIPALAEGGPAIIQGWKDAGFSKEEIEIKSKELMTAEGMPNTRLEDVVVRGSQKSTVVDGAVRSVVKLFQGANPFTVVEEFAHAEYDREIAEGTVTVEQVREWRKAVEELTETPDLRGETDEDVKEWVAEQVKARIYGQRNNLSLPESFLKFLDNIISKFKQILSRAKELQDLEASGQLPADFLEMLDRQGLVGKPQNIVVDGSSVTLDPNAQIFPSKDGGVVGPATFSLEAFHGTPHKVDNFSTEKIGTGEGAQVYGWGLYFAKLLEVADFYKNSDESIEIYLDGKAIFKDGYSKDWITDEEIDIINAYGSVSEAQSQNPDKDYSDYEGRITTNERGNIYTVELNTEQDELLDWDKPLSEQSDKVKAALYEYKLSGNSEDVTLLRELYSDGVTTDLLGVFPNSKGGQIYNTLAGDSEDFRGLSEALYAVGIKGIRYLDGQSRNADWELSSPNETVAGDWMVKDSMKPLSSGFHFNTESDARAFFEEKSKLSFNYVVFNDSDITITKENGKAVALPKTEPSYSLAPLDEFIEGSEVVNPDGSAKKVFHGSPDVRAILSSGFKASMTRGDTYFFTDEESVANTYADDRRAFDYQNAEPQVLPVYLSLKNPLRIDGGGRAWRETEKHVEEARSGGHDGIIIKNSRDEYQDRGRGKKSTVYVVFSPKQIKSASDEQVRSRIDGIDLGVASFSLEPLSEQDADAEATVAAEERQSRTPERQAFIDYQRELRRTQLDNTEEEKEKLQKLLQIATDADEIEALKQAGDEKIIRVVEQKVKQIRKQAAEREDVTESVKALERLINSPEVPMEVRARMRGFGRLVERKTLQGKARWVEQMANKLEAEIDRHYRTRNVRTLRSLLRPFATEYAPNRRKLRERVGEEARAELNFAQRLLNNSEATPPEGITDERRDELIDIFGDVGNRQSNPTRVKAALEIAGSIAKGGRTSRDDFKEDRRQRNEQLGDLVREEVLKGEEAMGKSQIAAREKQRNVFKKGYDYMRSRLIRGMEGFQQQLNKMDSVKGGILEDLFLPAVYQADQNEKALNREHVERVNEDFKTVLGTDNRQAASWYENSHELHDTDIEWIEDKAIGMEKRTISKQQGVALFMQWLDPSLRSTFSNMGINEATIEQIKEFIGEIGVSEAYYFRERYAEMGIRLNAKHMEVEGIPLDMIDGYGGRARRINSVGSRQEDMQMFSTNASGRPTVKSGSMKERTNSTDYLIFRDASADFSAHAKEVNHYISHAELAKNLSAAFLNNARARNAITQKHGADFYESLKDQVEAIIEGDPKITNKTDRDWNRIRSNVTKAQLMAKPAILIKQLTSAPAFVEEIGPVAYAKAAASLTRNARKFMPMIWNSEYVKNRMSNSQFADIQQQLDQRDNTLKGLRWDDYAMMNVKWGDIGAVIAGGAPVYVHAYNEAKAAGMTNDQAQAKAEEVFGLASERAQQSSATHAKGAFLRGKGAARTWFMYLTSPLQYQRNVNTGIANLVANVFEKKAGRKSDVKKAANQALRAIVIYHVLLPQIFQAVASGLVGFTDDEDYIKEQFWAKQRRALYAGNLNAIPLAGQLITVLANLAAGTGESWDSSGSPIIDLVGEIKKDFEKAVKKGDDLSAWLELSSSAGLAAGIPVKTIKSYYDAITDISEGNTEHPFLRAGGWSKWSIFED